MIDGIGKAGSGRLELVRSSLDRAGAVAKAGDASVQRNAAGPSSASSEMAAAGAPVDSGKVAAIRAAIAEGRYPVDPDKIAKSMIELDLMPKGAA
jgi:negative regulator of flagellin synthesis FlgM